MASPSIAATHTAATSDPTAAPASVQNSGIGVYSWNPLTSCLVWDDTIAAIFDSDRPGELPLDTWLRRVHPDDRDRVMTTFSTFDEVEAVYRLVMADGSVRHLLSRVTHVSRDEAGEPLGVTGVMLDVTESLSTAARLTSMLDSITDGSTLR